MKPGPIEIPFDVTFRPVDEDGTEKVRACAHHAKRVGQAWIELGFAMDTLATSLDDLATKAGDDACI